MSYVKFPMLYRPILKLLLLSALLFHALPGYSQIKQLDSIVEKGKIIIAKGDKQFVPFEFINEKGEPDGFSVELFDILMKRIGVPYTLTLDDWGVVQQELDEKKIDIAIGMIYSTKRAEHLKFGIPHCMISYNIICRKDNDYPRIEDLKGKSIIVQNKDRAHEYLLSSGLTDKIITVESISEGIELLAAGKYDAVISFDATSFYYVRKGNYKNLRVHLTDIEPERYSIVVNSDNEDLLYLLNTALYQMKIDGEYDNLYYKWFGVFEKNKIYKTVWYILAALGLLLIWTLIFNWVLRSKVRKKTKDLQAKNDETLLLVDKLKFENMKRREVEKNLIIAKDKAEENDRLKSAFLANMSHEIRTPLNSIVGFASIISETEDAGQRAEYNSIIKTNSDQLLQLINDVLDLSKIESGTVKVNKTLFDVKELCESVMTSVSMLSTKPYIAFNKEFSYDCMVLSDRSLICQIITNFMTNAIKFTDRGSITIGTRCIDHKVEIFVKDTGAGIPEDKIDSIFTRFVKLNQFVQGNGLGLSICKHIANMLEIQIGVESKLGEGSKFWILIDEEPTES